MFRTILIIVLLFISPIAYSEWNVVKKIDSMTDEHQRMAVTINKEGFAFSVYRTEKENGPQFWGLFSIPKNIVDQIHPERLIIYRVDKLDPVDISLMIKLLNDALGEVFYQWEPKFVNFRLLQSLSNLTTGERLLVRYYLPTGGYEEVSFSLKGSRKAIREAIMPKEGSRKMDLKGLGQFVEDKANKKEDKANKK